MRNKRIWLKKSIVLRSKSKYEWLFIDMSLAHAQPLKYHRNT